ncbi:MFS transporter [Chitinophaga sp. MD30]|uniref:MFS transporter n=1 Tax=Chitinophaga sp. MD30 TaxID=2033437 RepID=UPI0018E042BB|nr:MFS transporter [Chitinophaga sp. MD30]
MSERNTLTLPVTQNDKTDAAFFSIIVPIIISVFAIYLTIGMMLGVLPAFIKSDLKYGSLAVGIVIGIQSLATLLTRASAGKMTDTRGARASSYTGISLVMVSGILYLAVATFSQHRSLALGMILLARIVHGVAESMSVTGALTWGIGLVGIQKSGKVMTWNGIAMYAGIAIGAPLAIWMKETQGITYVFGTILALSVISWLSTTKLPDLPVDKSHIRTPFYKVIGVIAGQGLGLAFASIGFACISSFIALLFAERNWGNPSMAFMAFGMFYVLTRVFFSSFPDKYGGYQVALFSLFIEVIGQLLIGFASSESVALIGCSLTGAGFSLIFPALGVLAIKKYLLKCEGRHWGLMPPFLIFHWE